MRDDQINRMFIINRKKQRISNKDIEGFTDEFDKIFDEYFDEREEKIRKLMEEIGDQYAEKMIRWKQKRQNRRTRQLDDIK